MAETSERHTIAARASASGGWLWGVVCALLVGLAAVLLLASPGGRGVRLTPTDGSAPAATTRVTLALPRGADTEAVQAAFRIEPPSAGAFVRTEGGLVFVPAEPFPVGEPVTVTVGPVAGVRGLGRALSVTFTPRAPSIAYLAPAAGDAAAALWAAAPGADPVRLYAPEQGIFDFAPSPDGEWIAVTVPAPAGGAEIWLAARDGGGPRQVTDCSPLRCGAPAWSADGGLLAYERDEVPDDPGAPRRVWLLDVASGEAGPVYESAEVEGHSPRWSATGRTLAFYDASSRAIRVVDMLTGATEIVSSEMGEVGSLAPDGSALAYSDIRPVGRQFFPALWVAPVGGEAGPRPLLDDAQEDRAPRWSPDGAAIAFSRRRLDRTDGFASQLWLADPATGEARALAAWPELNITDVAWSPSGDALLVQRFPLGAEGGGPEIGVLSVEDGSFEVIVRDAYHGHWLP